MSAPAPLILLVEDEEKIRRLLRTALVAQGYRLAEAESGQQALRVATEQPPDLVILDLGLPDMDGQQVLSRLREWLQAPVIVLSARSQEKEKVFALDQGADDYVTKPFHMEELIARIRVALRHAARIAAGRETSTFECGDLKLDLAARRVLLRDTEVHLTPIEYNLLTKLVQNAGKVLTHRYLLREVWGPQDSQENHYLRVFVASLRRKIEDDPARPRYILTEQGVGYRFASE